MRITGANRTRSANRGVGAGGTRNASRGFLASGARSRSLATNMNNIASDMNEITS